MEFKAGLNQKWVSGVKLWSNQIWIFQTSDLKVFADIGWGYQGLQTAKVWGQDSKGKRGFLWKSFGVQTDYRKSHLKNKINWGWSNPSKSLENLKKTHGLGEE